MTPSHAQVIPHLQLDNSFLTHFDVQAMRI